MDLGQSKPRNAILEGLALTAPRFNGLLFLAEGSCCNSTERLARPNDAWRPGRYIIA